jgi:hypothetical protein
VTNVRNYSPTGLDKVAGCRLLRNSDSCEQSRLPSMGPIGFIVNNELNSLDLARHEHPVISIDMRRTWL